MRSPKSILLTGFEPFGGDSINPSWEAVRRLEGRVIAGHTVHARQMPCVFGAALVALEAEIALLRPRVTLCVGLAAGRAEISLERVAINVDDARIPDNAGAQPVDTAVVAGGPAAYFTSLPVKAIAARLRQHDIPVAVSQTAGTFVCNHLFYGACSMRARRFRRMRTGFIHIPLDSGQAAHHPGVPVMASEVVVRALELALETALTTVKDIVAGEGAVS
jgi:pyroglutamyl-peptidase